MAAPALPSRGGVTSNGKTSLTTEQAATELLRAGATWSATAGTATTVTYAYRESGSTTANGVSGFAQVSAAQMATIEQALATWSDVANITFVRVGTGTSGAAAYSNDATILFGDYTSGDGSAFAYLPTGGSSARAASSLAGDVWFPTGSISWAAVHEIGHAIGLSHPSDYNGGTPTYAANAEYYEDSESYTVMSYFARSNTGGAGSTTPTTPLLDDITAIQRAYGANMTTRTGDTVYGFNTNAGALYAGTATAAYAIWDAGGIDTLDFSGNAKTQVLDLRAGAFSTINGSANAIAIAYNVTIENAIGGSGVDTLIGNAADNRLEGNAGNDTLYGEAGNDVLLGGAGNDWLEGGTGADAMTGGIGNDTYVVDTLADTVVEGAGGGTDTVFALSSYILAADASVEVLALQNAAGTDAFFLTGSTASQSITGNAGDNIINGMGGADTMYGLAGNDTFLVRGPGDVVIELPGGGADIVYTTVSYNLGENEVEALSTVENAALDPINLIGNYVGQTIVGNYGANLLNGGSGLDTLIGLRGDDTYAVGDSRIVVIEAAGEGTDTLVTSVDYRLAAGVSVEVLAAQDRASTAPLALRGNEFGQTIAGTAGADTLDGGGAADMLIGGAGADRFVFSSALGGGNVDTISDFEVGVDRIVLSATVFAALGAANTASVTGSVAAASFGTGAVATTPDQRLVYDAATGQVSYDADGSGAGAAVAFAALTPGLALSAASFEIVAATTLG